MMNDTTGQGYTDQLMLPLAEIAGNAENWLHLHTEALAREEHDQLHPPVTTYTDLSTFQSTALEISDILQALTRRPALAPWAATLTQTADDIKAAALRLDDAITTMPGYPGGGTPPVGHRP